MERDSVFGWARHSLDNVLILRRSKMYKQKQVLLNQLQVDLELLIKKYNGELLCFDYYKKTFGNIVVKIKKNKDIFTFTLERGDIYCNCKSGIDGLTRTISSIAYDSYTSSEYNKFLEFIESIIKNLSDK